VFSRFEDKVYYAVLCLGRPYTLSYKYNITNFIPLLSFKQIYKNRTNMLDNENIEFK
jgi:hypothetical protein